MNLNQIVNSLPGKFGEEIIASVIVALTLTVFGLAFKGIRSFFINERRENREYPPYPPKQTYDDTYKPDFFDEPYPKRKPVQPENNNQAMWAAGLAFASYVCWVTVPLLALPLLLVSLWLGFNSRRHTAGKVAIFTSCFHMVLLVCGIILIIVLLLVDNGGYGYYYW